MIRNEWFHNRKLTKITIPQKSKVFLLEDSSERIEWFTNKVSNLTITSTASDAIKVLSTSEPFDMIFLDHDLGLIIDGTIAAGTGMQVAEYLSKTTYNGKNILVHSWNSGCAEAMGKMLDCVVIPFGQFEIETTYD